MSNTKTSVELHGWYSKQQERIVGSLVYVHENGSNTIVTSVSYSAENMPQFSDVKYA